MLKDMLNITLKVVFEVPDNLPSAHRSFFPFYFALLDTFSGSTPGGKRLLETPHGCSKATSHPAVAL
jgi:hypothetical protein